VVYYVVNSNYIKLLDIDGLNLPGIPPNVLGLGAMYSAASPAQLSTGNYVFTVDGGTYVLNQTSPPPVAAGGVFTSPGGSGPGNLSGLALDVNDSGKVKVDCTPTGTFSAITDGRGTLTFGGTSCAGSDAFSNFAIYPTAASGPLNGGVLMLQIDPGSGSLTVTAGTAYPQASSPSFSGTYGGVFDSIVTEPDASGSNYAIEQDAVGQITVSSSSICSGGSSCGNGMSTGMYINQADGDPNQVQALGPYPASRLSGSFASGSNGRYVETVTVMVNGTPYTLDEIFYAGVDSNNTVLSLETNAFGVGSQSFTGPGTGLLQIQNLTIPSVLPQSQMRQSPGFSLLGTTEPPPAKPEPPQTPGLR
jgi:hypothetical protein